jgi:hypothetical protein
MFGGQPQIRFYIAMDSMLVVAGWTSGSGGRWSIANFMTMRLGGVAADGLALASDGAHRIHGK